MNLSALQLAIVVVHAKGCGHCREYLPRVRKIAEKYAACIPTVLIDAAEGDLQAQLATALGARVTPTTTLIRNGSPTPLAIEGNVKDAEIEKLYKAVAGECAVG